VTYYYFSEGNCPFGGVQVGSPVSVTNGMVPNSNPQQFNNAGSYSWAASYSGDANNNPKLGSCESLTVVKAVPSLNISLAANDPPVGYAVLAEASLARLSPTAGGDVTYEYFSGNACQGPATFVSNATVANGATPHSIGMGFGVAGSYSWNAVYNGDSNNKGAISSCEPFTIAPATVTAITNLVSPITVGGSVTDSVSLVGATPNAGGTVTYYYFSGGTCAGTATKVNKVNVSETVRNLIVAVTVPNSKPQQFNNTGSYSWDASYSGDANNAPATSQCEKLTVKQASPTITLSLTPTEIMKGQTVYGSATLGSSFHAGGTVSLYYFYDNLCKANPVSVGDATVSNSVVSNSIGGIPPYVGSYYWDASYSGDANNSPTTSQCEFVPVNSPGASITTVLSPFPAFTFSPVTDSATLSGTTPSAGGSVTYEFFSGGYCASSAIVTPTTINNLIVTVTDGVVPKSDSHVFTTPGSYSWYAFYSGDSNNNAATSPCEPLTVNLPMTVTVVTPTGLTLSCGHASVVVGSAATCKAKVVGSGSVPTGSVAWSTNSTGTLSSASCTLSIHKTYSTCSVKFTPVAAGYSIIVTASYGGDSNNPPSAGTYSLTVTMKATKTTVSCSPTSVHAGSSKAVTCKAKVKGYGDLDGESVTLTESGTGFVTFVTATCTLVKGNCSVTLVGTQAGSVTVTASYGGDPNNQPSHGTANLTVKNAT